MFLLNPSSVPLLQFPSSPPRKPHLPPTSCMPFFQSLSSAGAHVYVGEQDHLLYLGQPPTAAPLKKTNTAPLAASSLRTTPQLRGAVLRAARLDLMSVLCTATTTVSIMSRKHCFAAVLSCLFQLHLSQWSLSLESDTNAHLFKLSMPQLLVLWSLGNCGALYLAPSTDSDFFCLQEVRLAFHFFPGTSLSQHFSQLSSNACHLSALLKRGLFLDLFYFIPLVYISDTVWRMSSKILVLASWLPGCYYLKVVESLGGGSWGEKSWGCWVCPQRRVRPCSLVVMPALSLCHITQHGLPTPPAEAPTMESLSLDWTIKILWPIKAIYLVT